MTPTDADRAAAQKAVDTIIGGIAISHSWFPYGKLIDAVALALAEQRERLLAECKWLDEFVVEPESFQNEGDRQWWRERRQALREGGT